MNTSKYNANESHIFICSNCGYEFSYRLPKIVIDSMNGVLIHAIKKECPKCNQYTDARRKQ